MAAIKRVRVGDWRTEDPRELKRQLKVFEDYVQQLQLELERLRQQVVALTP